MVDYKRVAASCAFVSVHCFILQLHCAVMYCIGIFSILQPGGLKTQMQKYKEAVNLFQEALTIDPNSKMATSGLQKTMNKK